MPPFAHELDLKSSDPFSHMIVFQWYDGPIRGLARSARSGSTYYFTMLDCDESLNHRAYALYEIGHAVYDDCLRVLSSIEEPKYPLWCPTLAPGQLDLSRWSTNERSRLRAVIGSSRYLDHIAGVHEVAPQDALDLAEWNPDNDRQADGWMERLFEKSAD